MADTITACIEEEYSFALSYLWRRRSGWRPLLMYFRGPGGVPFFLAPILTLIGIWRFARRPLRLADADRNTLIGAEVLQTDHLLGSYGMGGPGFAGIRVRRRDGSSIWIVFTIWGAATWLTLNNDLLSEGYFPDVQKELSGTWQFRPLHNLIYSRITDIRLEKDMAELSFSSLGSTLVLTIRRDSGSLPVHYGSKEPKVLDPSQDIRDAVIISRRASLWLD